MGNIEFGNYSDKEEKDSVVSEVCNFIWELVKIILLALIIVMPIRIFLFQPFKVEGASMYPNFYNKDWLIVSELGYKEDFYFFKADAFREINRGDTIVFRPDNSDRKKYYIKRVIGMPGETLSIGNNQIVIYNGENPNGFVLKESDYLPEDMKTCVDYGAYSCEQKTFKLKEDEYFFMGDNRTHSSDSRVLGAITADRIIGKVAVRLWPITRLKIF